MKIRKLITGVLVLILFILASYFSVKDEISLRSNDDFSTITDFQIANKESFIEEIMNAIGNKDLSEVNSILKRKTEDKKVSDINFDDLPPMEKIEVSFGQHLDGDTSIFVWNDQKIKVRYLLIDTPETIHESKPVMPYGKDASKLTKKLLSDAKSVQIMFDYGKKKDHYGRYLCYVFADGIMIQEELIKNGLAIVDYVDSENSYYESELIEMQKIAKNEKLNIWSLKGYVTSNGKLNSEYTK